MIRFAVVLAVMAGFIPTPVVAGGGDLAHAQTLYSEGAFLEAAETGARTGTATGLALAARAMLAYAAYGAPEAEKPARLEAAEALARRALEQDPNNVEAMLHLVIALGYRARLEGAVTAHFRHRGSEAAKLLKRALALAPASGWVFLTLGGWHAEVVASGGPVLARTLYGASLGQAIANFERALALLPDNPVARVEFAKALLRTRPKKYAARARTLLEEAQRLAPRDAFERRVAAVGEQILAALDSRSPKDVRALVKQLEPFHRALKRKPSSNRRRR